ncbi:carboxypeptidase-like regulatory domain-containing protein [Hymenobacter sp.]|uniref:carboxypeptidase-like regulatory domain-containing protein n=1 Tax=Hymenobacter sp. TaxID=1898978 RepID=UPI00286ACE29|nr:carboxypeptidase-like regulatory domain-containing protein [Hymenobacter sp.]
MQYFSKVACVALCAVLLLNGCTGKDGDPGPAGPAGPSGQNLTGNITGFVNSVDENGSPLAKAGVLVAVDGVTPAITATSDADGRFTLSNLRSGTYNLTFTRQGYSTFRRFGVGHVGGDQPTFLGTVTISQPSTQAIPIFSAGTPSSANPSSVPFTLGFTSQSPTTNYRYVLFASASPNPTAASGALLQNGNITINGSPSTTIQLTLLVNRAQFINAGFAPGTTVYVIAYGSTTFTAFYVDAATGRTVFPTLNPQGSSVTTLIVP